MDFGRAARCGAVGAALLATGCVDNFLSPEPGDDPVTIFDLVWIEFDRHYAFFDSKQVDWAGLRDQYRASVTASTSPEELFQVLSDMLANLEDGHVTLGSPFDLYTYTGWYEGHARNFTQQVAFGHLQEAVRWTPSFHIAYGRLTDDVGYVYIPGFPPGSWASEIDDALDDMSGVGALVVDVRSNGGGTDLITEEILARFMDRERVYRYHRYRNGPEHDDFTDLIADRIAPLGRRFEGPVALLTNRRTYSAAEDFVLGMRLLDRVTTVGDTTGGGMGNPINRELPNGWTFAVPRWQVFTADREPIPDGVGFAPDAPVFISTEDADQGRDTILLAALELLRERLAEAR